MSVVPELPDHFFRTGNFKELRLFAQVAMTQVIAEHRIAIGQALTAGKEPKWVLGKVIFVNFPNHPLVRIQLNRPVTVPTGDEQMSSRQDHHFVGITGDLNTTENPARSIKFHHFTLAFETDEIVPVRSFPSSPKLIVRGDGRGGRQFDFFGNFPRPIHFDDATGTALDEQDPTFGEGLARMDLNAVRRFVLPHDSLVRGDFQGPGDKTKKHIPVGQLPAVLRRFARVLPFDLSVAGNAADLSIIVVTTEKRMCCLKR